ncbi:DUF3299 domain-containing protein [Loktanella sp. SALINAS62]|uniref:DUF3299 domain-containing protein n=1 Tax=Loktanella sp. SALINAS62 TaxID=2706124 RepID=UPI001B8B4187|nr:DUF3299 domain-containing protein [Loktanella sp. SALINAS62]MBS1302896.1 DUF3299 domain-containing protein [Loktanella sp. SALINAS62]
MVTLPITRRGLCLGLAGLAGLRATGLRADDIVDLQWRDLVPENQDYIPPALQGFGPHDETAMASQQPASSGIRSDWNGRIVRLSGFIIPLDFDGQGVTVFMLVPFVGACIHVPPPPANQLVLVTTERPFESDRLFAPITVTGMFGAAATQTQLAEVGYALSADDITPYRT